jgi:hypothetical protein
MPCRAAYRVDEAVLDGRVLPAARLQPRREAEAVVHPVQQRVRVYDHQPARGSAAVQELKGCRVSNELSRA